MRGGRIWAVAGAVACLLGTGVTGMGMTAANAAKTTFVVDDDRRQCRNADFQSINQAILAAPPGATIQVCAGVYNERVNVLKPVTLLGARNGNGAAGGRDDLSKESVVVNDGSSGFDVVASDVVIDGFTVIGNPAATSYPNAGIYVRTGANRELSDNVLRSNGLGVYIEGAQSALTIERNAIQDNRREPNPFFIPAGGIFAAGGLNAGVEILDNFFTNNGQFSINIGSQNTGLVIAHNEAMDDATFLVLGNSDAARVEYNRLEALRGSGIFLFGNTNNVAIEHNQIDTGAGQGINVRGRQFGTTMGNVGTLVRYNNVTRMASNGINLSDGTTGALVAHNLTDENLRGIRLFDSVNSRVENNNIRDNVESGIRVDPTSAANTIADNRAYDNGIDCRDDSAGPGTSGTANFWINDKGDTENRPGLCEARGEG